VTNHKAFQFLSAKLARAERRLQIFPCSPAYQSDVKKLTEEVDKIRAALMDSKRVERVSKERRIAGGAASPLPTVEPLWRRRSPHYPRPATAKVPATPKDSGRQGGRNLPGP
jgi:hypothetical protein